MACLIVFRIYFLQLSLTLSLSPCHHFSIPLSLLSCFTISPALPLSNFICLSLPPLSSSVPRHDAPDRNQRQTPEGERERERERVQDRGSATDTSVAHPTMHVSTSHTVTGGPVTDTSGVHPSMHASISHIATELLGVLRTLQSRYGTLYFYLTCFLPAPVDHTE